MNWFTRKLMCTQLDDKLQVLKPYAIPKVGWVKTIRTALGMSGAQLAKRCRVTGQRIQRIEKDEVAKKTTLNTLEVIANQLGCDLVYAFVPKTSIHSMIESQAEKKARQSLATISHSMSLEDQALDSKANQTQLDMLKQELLERRVRSIWEE